MTLLYLYYFQLAEIISLVRSKPSNAFPDYVAVRHLLLRMKERHVSAVIDAFVQSDRS